MSNLHNCGTTAHLQLYPQFKIELKQLQGLWVW